MKKRAIALVICLFIIIAAVVVYIFSELYTESDLKPNIKPKETDALKFKKEYEGLNGKTREKDGKVIRSISVADDNPFIYKTADDIVKMMDNNETFLVYFGFAECPWCRSVLETAIKEAKEKKIDKIYYVDVLNIRDTWSLDDNHKAVKTGGTEGYFKLLEKMDNVLSDASPLTYKTSKGKEKKVVVKEKRIYAPNYVFVKEGKAIALEEGISENQKDAFQELTDELKRDMKCKFDCFFDNYNKENESLTCDVSKQC